MKVSHAGNNGIMQTDEVNQIEIKFEGMKILEVNQNYSVLLFGSVGEKRFTFPHIFTHEFMDMPQEHKAQQNAIIEDIFKRLVYRKLDK